MKRNEKKRIELTRIVIPRNEKKREELTKKVMTRMVMPRKEMPRKVKVLIFIIEAVLEIALMIGFIVLLAINFSRTI